MMDTLYDSFAYYISPNETLFKGMNPITFNANYTEPSWFSLNKDTATGYGNYIHSIVTGRKLKLINIMSENFSIFLRDFVHDKYRNRTLADSYVEQMNLLVPIGLPDIDTQKRFIEKEHMHSPHPSVSFDRYGSIFNFKSRFSLDSLDKNLIDLMKLRLTQYNYDGYIAPCKWTSVYHGEFADEICIFDPSKCSLIAAGSTKRHLQQSAGGSSQEWFISPEPVDMNKIHIGNMRLLGYTGKIEYDKDGKMVVRDSKWIDEWIQEKNRKKHAGLLKRLQQSLKSDQSI